jgi:hypothetical protein
MKNFIAFLLLVLLSAIVTNAQTIFQKAYGSSSYDIGYDVRQTFDGGYIIAGAQHSFTTGNYDAYVIKTDNAGDTLWTKTYGGSLDDFAYSVRQTTDSGYIICGCTKSYGEGNEDVYLLKLTPNGDTLFTRTYGGMGTDIGNSIVLCPDEGFTIAGSTNSYGAGNDDVYLLRLKPNGDTLWTKIIGGNSRDYAQSISTTFDSGYILSGFTYTYGQGNGDVLMIKTDSVGASEFTKTYGWVDFESGYYAEQTRDSGYILMGTSGIGVADLYFIKTNPQGDTTFTKLYGGPSAQIDHGYCVHQTTDGGYILGGGTRDIGLSEFDVYLIRLNSNYDTVWTRKFGDINGDEEPYALIQTTDGGFMIGGYTTSYSAGPEDMYLIKTDSMGNGGCNQSTIYSHANNTLIYTNSPSPTISSGGLMGYTQSVIGDNAFINEPCSMASITDENSENLILLYPNPFTSQTAIYFSLEQNCATIKIIDILGQVVKTINFTGRQLVICKAEMKAGIYFVQVTDEEKNITNKKIIVQ